MVEILEMKMITILDLIIFLLMKKDARLTHDS